MKFFCKVLLIFILMFTLAKNLFALEVYSSIKPLHSLVEMVTDGIYITHLIQNNNNSPHDVTMSSKMVNQIKKADVVFIIDKNLEIPVYNALKDNKNLKIITDTPSIKYLAFSDKNLILKTNYINKDDHEATGKDFHVWLSPVNAKAILFNIAEFLSKKDPKNKAKYFKNYNKYAKELTSLDKEVKKNLKGKKNTSFIVFHNGYSYFERDYGLKEKAVITNIDDIVEHNLGDFLSNKDLLTLINFINDNNISCVLLEAQFKSPLLINFLKENKKDLKFGILDPVGYNLKVGKNLYYNLIRKNVNSFKGCL